MQRQRRSWAQTLRVISSHETGEGSEFSHALSLWQYTHMRLTHSKTRPTSLGCSAALSLQL